MLLYIGDIVAWIGMILSLFGVLLISLEKISPTGRPWLFINIISFILMSPMTLYRGAYQPVVLSGVFVLIVAIGYIAARYRASKSQKAG